MNQDSLVSLLLSTHSLAQMGASLLVDPADVSLLNLTTWSILALIGFFVSYFIFQIPMIIGDGLVRNIPILGVMFYRILALMVILLAAHLVATGLAGTFGELIPLTISNSTIQLVIISIFSTILIVTSYKKLETLLAATFYWNRSFGLLDIICLVASGWLFNFVASLPNT